VPSNSATGSPPAARGGLLPVVDKALRGRRSAKSPVKLTIELDREFDGRWIAEVPELTFFFMATPGRTQFDERSRLPGRLYSIGLHTASYPPIRRTPYSTSPHEFLASDKGAACLRRPSTNRLAP